MSQQRSKDASGVYLGLALGLLYCAAAVTVAALGLHEVWPWAWLAIVELSLLVTFLLGLIFLKYLRLALEASRFEKARSRHKSL
ncbi:hypothetical protein [Cupriavidus agavae]|uniref:Uncharacterized protein n=1 Tax=Cupriavidus agavae TaxID=1001822 RepID=A0A4Q7S8T6_9BURK|nr:hypothetical protein [Cupriavidus agavae]RZT42180.1 hypothetical protein EV147_1203 [Cupriavidus agavae]